MAYVVLSGVNAAYQVGDLISEVAVYTAPLVTLYIALSAPVPPEPVEGDINGFGYSHSG